MEGTRADFVLDRQDGETTPHFLVVSLFVTDKYRYVAQIAGQQDHYATYDARVPELLADLRPKGCKPRSQICRLGKQIVTRTSQILGMPTTETGAFEIGRRSRGTPRIANRLTRRVRDFAQVGGRDAIDLADAQQALAHLGVDGQGLDAIDRKILETIIEVYDGGPVGIEAIAATLGEPRDTLEDVYEPFLLQRGFIARTPRGRQVTRKALRHLGQGKGKGGGGVEDPGQGELDL